MKNGKNSGVCRREIHPLVLHLSGEAYPHTGFSAPALVFKIFAPPCGILLRIAGSFRQPLLLRHFRVFRGQLLRLSYLSRVSRANSAPPDLSV